MTDDRAARLAAIREIRERFAFSQAPFRRDVSWGEAMMLLAEIDDLAVMGRENESLLEAMTALRAEVDRLDRIMSILDRDTADLQERGARLLGVVRDIIAATDRGDLLVGMGEGDGPRRTRELLERAREAAD